MQCSVVQYLLFTYYSYPAPPLLSSLHTSSFLFCPFVCHLPSLLPFLPFSLLFSSPLLPLPLPMLSYCLYSPSILFLHCIINYSSIGQTDGWWSRYWRRIDGFHGSSSPVHSFKFKFTLFTYTPLLTWFRFWFLALELLACIVMWIRRSAILLLFYVFFDTFSIDLSCESRTSRNARQLHSMSRTTNRQNETISFLNLIRKKRKNQVLEKIENRFIK